MYDLVSAPTSVIIFRGDSIEFKMNIIDLPRDARICFSIHGVWVNPLKVSWQTVTM